MDLKISSTNTVAMSDFQSLSATALSGQSGMVAGATGVASITEVDNAALNAFQAKWAGVEASLADNGLISSSLQNLNPSLDPAAAGATLAKYKTALDANARSGQNAEAVATALVPVMQQLVQQRPELANAQFDFQSDNGSIKVTSSKLSDSDRQWIQNLLNSNGTLVQAVQNFHDDLVTGYTSWASASGNPLSDAQTQAVSQQADSKVSFLSLFHQMAVDNTQTGPTVDPNVYGLNGKKIDLLQNTGTANDFLSFMQDATASRYNAVYTQTPSGNAYGVGASGDIFQGYKTGTGKLALSFFPPDATLGVHETA